MAREDWETAMIYRSLHEEAEQIAKDRHFPNVNQYINDAVRRAVDADKAKLAVEPQN